MSIGGRRDIAFRGSSLTPQKRMVYRKAISFLVYHLLSMNRAPGKKTALEKKRQIYQHSS
jgi:hypothetical protein